MNRMSRFHHVFFRLPHGKVPVATIIIITIVISFAIFFFFSNDKAPVNHQTSNVKVKQSMPTPHKGERTPLKPKVRNLPRSRSPRGSRALNIRQLKIILNHSHLPINQRNDLVKLYQKLGTRQQSQILRLVNRGQNGIRTSQKKIKILKRSLRINRHNITSDFKSKRL